MPRYLLFGLFTAACCSSCTLAVDCYTTSGMNLTDCDRWLACKVSKGMLCDNGLGKLGTVLMMGGHQVQGTVPNDDLAEMTGLTSLSLASNFALTGPIPSAIGELTELTHLFLQFNAFKGPIPNAIGELTKLTYLDLVNNALTGRIPSAIGELTKLGYLNLANNALTGPIPSAIGELTSLTYLSLMNNEITGGGGGGAGEVGICSIVENLIPGCLLSPNPSWTNGTLCPACLNNGGSCTPPVKCIGAR